MKYKNVKDRVELYSETDTEYKIGGHCKKTFIRINDNTLTFDKKVRAGASQSQKRFVDSEFFADAFRALSKKNCHFITYLNSLVAEKSAKERYIPKFVSCLIKRNRTDSYYGEVVGSRLANLAEVDTVFNIVNQSEEELYSEGALYPNFDSIISIDFVSYGEKTEDLQTLGVRFNEDSRLEFILSKVDKLFPQIALERGWKLTDEAMYKFKENFVRMFIFRSLICEDYDFEAKNVGIIDDEKGNFRLAPCFDMEYMFKGQRGQRYYNQFAMDNISYAMQNFPNATLRLAKVLKTNLDNGNIVDIMTNTVPARKDALDRCKKLISKNIKFLDDVVNGRVRQEDFEYDML